MLIATRKLDVLASLIPIMLFCAALAIAAGAAAETTLQVAVVWGEDSQEWQGFLAAGEAFERLHPGVQVEFLPVTGWLGSNTEQTAKLMTLIAGGLSPDLTLVDGMMVPQFGVTPI